MGLSRPVTGLLYLYLYSSRWEEKRAKPRNLQERQFQVYPEEDNNVFLRNVGVYLPRYTPHDTALRAANLHYEHYFRLELCR